MLLKEIRNKLFTRNYHANDLTAWTPQFWAQESLMILNEELFAPALVHRDFENLIASMGDTVMTRRPNEFTAVRKVDGDNITIQNLTATKVAVTLDQQPHVAFLIYDGEWSKGMPQLLETHLRPAVIALARQADRVIFSQVMQFMMNSVGGLGQMTDTNAKDFLLYARQRANYQKIPEEGRKAILNLDSETTVLRPQWFVSAEKVGDGGKTLREARLGMLFGIEWMRSNNMPNILPGSTSVLRTTTAATGVGATVITTNAFAAALPIGSFCTVDGLPNIVVASTTTSQTLRWPLRRATASGVNFVSYTPAAVNAVAGYAAGYAKEITIDTTAVGVSVGQAISFGLGTAAPIYTVISTNADPTIGITLDRPLEAAIANNDNVNIGPTGGFNWLFHKNAVSFVQRPLALPDAALGVKAAVVSSNDMAIRVLMQYDINQGATIVNLDMLCGVKILDTNLGVVLAS